MTEQEYRQHSGVNKSALWMMQRSAAHYKNSLETPEQDTDAFRIGRAIHAAILTPILFRKGWVTAPQVDRRTKEGREQWAVFCADNADKEILSPDEMQLALAVAKKVRSNAEVTDLLSKTKKERPVFWTDKDTGLDCKCRFDAIKKGVCIDIKTTRDASTDSFVKEALRLGYDVQAAHYSLAHESLYGVLPEWYFVCVEKEPPYAVNLLHADGSFIDYGYCRRQELMQKLKDSIDTGTWNDYGSNELMLPEWVVY